MTLSLTKHVASALSLSAKRAIQTANSKLSLKNNSSSRAISSHIATYPTTPLLLLTFPFFKGKREDSADSIEDVTDVKQPNPLPLPDESTVSLHHLVRNSASVTGEDAGSLLSLALQQVRLV